MQLKCNSFKVLNTSIIANVGVYLFSESGDNRRVTNTALSFREQTMVDLCKVSKI